MTSPVRDRRNVGLIDRGARFVLGVMLLGLYGALEPPLKYLTLAGLLLIASAVTAICPLYSWLGIHTRRRPDGGAGPD